MSVRGLKIISVSVNSTLPIHTKKEPVQRGMFSFHKEYYVHWEKESVWRCLWFMPSLCIPRQVPTCPRLESTYLRILEFCLSLKEQILKAWILFKVKKKKKTFKDYEERSWWYHQGVMCPTVLHTCSVVLMNIMLLSHNTLRFSTEL